MQIMLLDWVKYCNWTVYNLHQQKQKLFKILFQNFYLPHLFKPLKKNCRRAIHYTILLKEISATHHSSISIILPAIPFPSTATATGGAQILQTFPAIINHSLPTGWKQQSAMNGLLKQGWILKRFIPFRCSRKLHNTVWQHLLSITGIIISVRCKLRRSSLIRQAPGSG